MSEGRLFNCPSCGSSLSPAGEATAIKCPYCGSEVIVPPELRAARTPAIVLQTAPLSSEPSKGSGGAGWIIALVVLVAVAASGVALFAALGAGAKPKPALVPTAVAKASPTAAGFAHVVLSFGGEGTAPGLFQQPRHIAIDPNGKIYVADIGSLRIQQFDPNGKYVSGWTVDSTLCSNSSAGLNTLAADRAGNVYVNYCGWIVKYDGATGKQVAKFRGSGGSTNDFYLGVAAIPDGGLLVLADGAPAADEVLLKLDPNGKVLARVPDLVTQQSKQRASALTLSAVVDGLGNIYILNSADNAVYRFTSDGKYVNKFGSVGTSAGQFENEARDIALDNQSRVYVADGAGIKLFDSNGTYLDQTTDPAVRAVGELRIDDKNQIYVVGNNSTIIKLQMNGE